jgi:hypothetical protein
MILFAALLFGGSVGTLTVALWPRPRPPAPRWDFVEDPNVPRTLH